MSLQFKTSGGKDVIDKHGNIAILCVKNDSETMRVKHNSIRIGEACVYDIRVNFMFELNCPVGSATIELVKAGSPNLVLAAQSAQSGEKSFLVSQNVLGEGDKLFLAIRTHLKVCKLIVEGSIVEQEERCALLKKTTAFDDALNVQYITNQPLDNFPPAPPFKPQFPANIQFAGYPPGFVPWESIVIPWQADQTPVPLANPKPFPNNNWYDKYQSVQYSVFFYLGLNMFTIPPDSPQLTIFIKNFVDRGDRNYLKQVYMSALTSEKMSFYAEKIDTMLNEAYTRFTVNHEPVISAFKEVLINFFLSIHIGEDNYPPYVLEYFATFIDIIGFGDTTRAGRNEAMIRGNYLAPRVKEYFEQRRVIVVANKDTSTIAYYWDLAGLPVQSLLIECVHNIVAFSQYNNTLYRLIADKLWAGTGPDAPRNVYGFPAPTPNNPPFGSPPQTDRGNLPYWYPYPPINQLALPSPPFPPISAGPVDFFEKLIAAPTAADRLNVVREAYRLLSPNTNAFSKLQTGAVDFPPTQARHIWQQISVFNEPLPFPVPPEFQSLVKAVLFFQYKPAIYDADFRTSVEDFTPLPPSEGLDPRNLFEFSPTDNNPEYDDGTVLEKDNPKLFPVFDTPRYFPFGPSYRRCAGETLNYFLTEKLIKRFADLEWEVRPVLSPPDYPSYETLAPFTAVPNNIFVRSTVF
jgi:hypothetical protein